MSILEEIKNKIKITDELLTLVRTMKVLATSSIHQYQTAHDSLQNYFETIAMGFQILVKSTPQLIETAVESEKIGAIIFGSDLGMCGKFNEQIADFAINSMASEKISFEDRRVMTIGEHVTNNFLAYPHSHNLLFPVSLDGIKKILSAALTIIEGWIINEKVSSILLFYNKPAGEFSYKPTMVKILPLDSNWLENLAKRAWPNKVLPTFFIKERELFSALVREYLYISLQRTFVESLLSENVSRLSSMQYAENHILNRLDELNLTYNQQWQSNITEEILEIVEGYEASQKPKEKAD